MLDSEFRLYGFILDGLKDMGWNTTPPSKGGAVCTQHEVKHDPDLKAALGRATPENVVIIESKEYWAIEAKSDVKELRKAVKEAKGYAKKINDFVGGGTLVQNHHGCCRQPG